MQNIIGLLVTFLTLAASGVTGSDFYTSTYLPVQLMQRIKRFVRISAVSFSSRELQFSTRENERWNGLRSKLTVCTMRERSLAYDFPCLGRSL